MRSFPELANVENILVMMDDQRRLWWAEETNQTKKWPLVHTSLTDVFSDVVPKITQESSKRVENRWI